MRLRPRAGPPLGADPATARQLTLALALALALSGCTVVEVTPARVLGARRVPAAERIRLFDGWRAALRIANGFLASEQCITLPRGRIELDSQAGMTFVAGARRVPLRVRYTTWGDWVVAFGSVAQERGDGFVVGRAASDPRDLAVDNSLFYGETGAPRPPPLLARVILHETAHIVLGVGTVGPWSSLRYYVEVLFCWRTHNEHSAELGPRLVDAELARHLAGER